MSIIEKVCYRSSSNLFSQLFLSNILIKKERWKKAEFTEMR